MEIVYYIVFSIFVSLPTNSLPIPNDNNGVANSSGTLIEPLAAANTAEESLADIPRKREISQDAGKTNELEDSSDKSKDTDNEQVDQDDSESLKGSEARNYRPFFRFQKVSRTRFTRPKYPLSNYANDRDRFPTTF